MKIFSRLRCIIFCCACCSLGSGVATAQSDTAKKLPPLAWVGANFGYGLMDHLVSGITCSNGCPPFNGGIGSGPFFGVTADWYAFDHAGISVRARYLASYLNLNSTYSGPGDSAKNEVGKVVPLVRQYTLGLSIPEIMFDISGWYAFGKLKVFGGWAMGLLTNPTWSSSATIISPGNLTYGNNLRDTTFFPTRPLDSARKTQFYLEAGVSYDIPLSRQLALVPEVRATYMLTSMRTSDDWKEIVFEASASLKYGISLGEKSAPLPEPVVAAPLPAPAPTPPPPTPAPVTLAPPAVKLAINAVDKNGKKEKLAGIRVDVQFVTEAFPLLPFVFFDNHAVELPQRYVAVTKPDAFSIDALSADPLQLHRNILNVIGYRLRKSSTATITIRGYADPTTENASCDLATSRSETVRAYLMHAWGIDSSRIIIKTSKNNCAPELMTVTKSEQGYADNRRAELESNDPTILAPIERKQFAEPLLGSPPAIEYDPSGSAAGIAKWRIVTTQDGNTVMIDSGVGSPSLLRRALGSEQAEALQSNSPIYSSLTIIDNNGMTASATDTIMLKKDTLDTEVERLSLTLFGTSQDDISPEKAATIKRFMQNFDPADSISIRGYTDKFGDEALNENLSSRRAENVRALIHSIVPTAKRIYSEGISYHQFSPGVHSYDAPEERFLSRTVQIEVRKKRK